VVPPEGGCRLILRIEPQRRSRTAAHYEATLRRLFPRWTVDYEEFADGSNGKWYATSRLLGYDLDSPIVASTASGLLAKLLAVNDQLAARSARPGAVRYATYRSRVMEGS
jgi:hypothetical protein